MFSCAVSAYSQAYPSVPVTISTEKVKAADGTMCYSHIVRERQTVYSISKAYQVSIGDIYKYNPKLPETGLMKNIIILIPVVEKEKPEVKQETAVITKEEKKQETIASWESMSIEEHMALYEKEGLDSKEAMKKVAKDRGVGKREIYEYLHKK